MRIAPPLRRIRRVLLILAVLFTTTGFVGLIVEQIFEKLLGTVVGASTPAAATVLAAYFAGLTAGALAYARRFRPKIQNPIRVYAILEGGVALLLLLTLLLFEHLVQLSAPLFGAARQSPLLLHIARFLVSSLVIIPPTFLMGASLPAIADSLALLRLPSRERLLTLFYAFNLGGAIVATVVGPYFLLPALGLDGTLALCAALGGAVSLVALRLSRATFLRHRGEVEAAAVPSAEGRHGIILAVAFGSGFVFFGLEVLWIHLLTAVIGNSVYAFATMLTVVLSGLALGSGIIAAIVPRGQTATWVLPAALMIGGGAALMATHGIWPAVPHSLALSATPGMGFLRAELLRFSHALAAVMLPATVLGMVFPSLFRMAAFRSAALGDLVGRAVAANAIGCVFGALGMTFVLLPQLGSENLLRWIAILLVVIGALLIAVQRRTLTGLAAAAAGIAIVVSGLPLWERLHLTSGEHVYFRALHVTPDSRLLFFHEDTAGGITTVVGRTARRDDNQPFLSKTLLTNGKFQGNNSGEREAQVAFALIPSMMVSRFDDALVIGVGTGASADIVHTLGFRSVALADISPGIIDAARNQFADLNHRVMERPNVITHIEDGRNVLLIDPQEYDLITMEISSIWFANATNLYSREFYEVARRRLRPGGVMQQWIQLHHIAVYDVASVVASMRSVFQYVSLWVAGGQGILVGTDEPQVIREKALLQMVGLRQRLGWSDAVFTSTIRQFAGGQILSPPAIDRMMKSEAIIVNTDRNRFLEYSTPRSNLNESLSVEAMVRRLQSWSDRAGPLIESRAAAMLR